MVWPRLTTATHLGVIATGDSAEAAARAAFTDMLAWLRQARAMSAPAAYMLLATAAEARFSILSYKPYVCVCKIARARLPRVA